MMKSLIKKMNKTMKINRMMKMRKNKRPRTDSSLTLKEPAMTLNLRLNQKFQSQLNQERSFKMANNNEHNKYDGNVK